MFRSVDLAAAEKKVAKLLEQPRRETRKMLQDWAKRQKIALG
jgi:hypothetical protein